jgi:hypothetical protein
VSSTAVSSVAHWSSCPGGGGKARKSTSSEAPQSPGWGLDNDISRWAAAVSTGLWSAIHALSSGLWSLPPGKLLAMSLNNELRSLTSVAAGASTLTAVPKSRNDVLLCSSPASVSMRRSRCCPSIHRSTVSVVAVTSGFGGIGRVSRSWVVSTPSIVSSPIVVSSFAA